MADRITYVDVKNADERRRWFEALEKQMNAMWAEIWALVEKKHG